MRSFCTSSRRPQAAARGLARGAAPCRFAHGADPGQPATASGHHEARRRPTWATPGSSGRIATATATGPLRAFRDDLHEQCLRRAGPPALRPGTGLRRPGLLALDPGAPGSPADRSPMAHQRSPDRARRVQVVRQVWRSTWTRRARPGRGDLRHREASICSGLSTHAMHVR